MGLDGLELVMECEDEFGIHIPDADASATRTPGQLTKLVVGLMRQSGVLPSAPACQSARVFYEVRRGLMNAGIKRSGIRPSAKMGQLLPMPRDVRRSEYVLRVQLGDLTRRTRTDHVFRFLAPTLVTVAAVPVVYYSTAQLPDMLVAVNCMAVLLIFLLVFAWYDGQKSTLINPDQSLGELINRSMSGLSPFDADSEGLMVWLRVRMLIAEQLGLSVDRVTPDADFVRDLGLR